MIDYEFTIRRLERELAHVREMQQIDQAHIDAHDRSMEGASANISRIDERLDRITATLDRIALQHAETEVMMTKNAALIQELINAIIQGRTDGKSGQ